MADSVGQPKKKSWLHFPPLVRLARMKKQLSIPIKGTAYKEYAAVNKSMIDVEITGEHKVKEEAKNQKAVADKKVVKGETSESLDCFLY